MPAGPVTLVAHSSGGLVVPGVSPRSGVAWAPSFSTPPSCRSRGAAASTACRSGTATACASPSPPPTKEGGTITLPGPPADPEAFRRAYGGDPLDDATLAFVVDPVRSVEDTVHHYFQPVHWSTAAGVPITYVLNERDKPVRPDDQEAMARRLPAPVDVIRVDSGHLLPVTSPAVFAEIVTGVAV